MKIKRIILILCAVALSACSLVNYQPTQTISRINPQSGYRLEEQILSSSEDDTLIIMMFSGGGTRAAALGYGVLEELQRYPMRFGKQVSTITASTDVVFGVSGGSVLAMYYALHGVATIPWFEEKFLKQNFQRQMLKQTLSLANMPRLTSPEFGRGDLLQEQFESTLFKKATFGDLVNKRKGPFAVISATDMSAGQRIDFTQETFDQLCLNLSDLRLARAVAASSSVPLVFAPITLNNHGGNCQYTLPTRLQAALQENQQSADLSQKTRDELVQARVDYYADSQKRPYIHLIDGGLTDNLGLRALLDMQDINGRADSVEKQMTQANIKKVIIINVNAQNEIVNEIDKIAAVPGWGAVLDATINIPIDKFSQESLRRFRATVDEWNTRTPIKMHFVSLSLRDLPESDLRQRVLNIPTTFYLPRRDINDLKAAAPILLNQSKEFQQLIEEIGVNP